MRKMLASIAVLGACVSSTFAAEPPRPAVRFDVPAKGHFSLGVYDDAGTLIRSLAYAQPTAGGTESLEWNATTDLGLPAQPGAYSVRGVWFAQPPAITAKMKVGLSGDPPYVLDNGLGGWGGNLGPPMDVCSDGKVVFAAFGCVESHNETGLQLMDVNGTILRRYSSFFPW
ncbi:MAG TPA: FlgD immunoglobulin-like domain containing protein, partial [Planctomycetota bacterium]|nr:FlgD immunoglobulin-like domain containing protein [Planctomycetota bacterium]